MRADDRVLRGIGLRVGAALLFSLMAALLKLASSRGVTVPELMFYRSAFALPVVLGWVLAGPGIRTVATRRPLAHLWRCALGTGGMLLVFQALALLPLAEATTINFTAPVCATILSWLVLGEKVGRHRWGAVLLGFVGVAIVLRPEQASSPVPALGVAIGLAAALFAAAVTITLRHLQESVAATVFWFTTATTLIGLAMLPFFGQLHDWSTIAVLLAAGATAGIAQLLMTASLAAAPVSVVMPFDYFQLFGALLLGWLLFATTPTLNTLAGAALIIAAGLYTVWRERRRHLHRTRLSLGAAEPI